LFSQYGQEGEPIQPSTTRVFEGLAEGRTKFEGKDEKVGMVGMEVKVRMEGLEVGVRMCRVMLEDVGQEETVAE
jgi:hypothetical protein